MLAVGTAAAPSPAVSATTSNKPSESQEAAGSASRGEAQEEGPQSQQESKEETPEGEITMVRKNRDKIRKRESQ